MTATQPDQAYNHEKTGLKSIKKSIAHIARLPLNARQSDGLKISSLGIDL
ncbi:MAG: hypothetical protein LUC45_01965 [Paraprevotella sp.]|nr:hypothetical protein [Paraprevotella sp.]